MGRVTYNVVAIMNPRPNPSETRGARTAQRRLEDLRNVFCHHYNGCLDHAMREDWSDWTCARCPIFREAGNVSATQFARDQPHPFD